VSAKNLGKGGGKIICFSLGWGKKAASRGQETK